MGATAYRSSSRKPKECRCNTCGKTFNSAEELSSHQRMEHSQSSQPLAGVS